MPKWSVDIEKLLRGEYWTNRYWVKDDNMAQALISADMLYTSERAIHKNNVLFTKLRVSDGLPNTDVYQIVNLNTFGVQVPQGDELPLFCIVRVDFNTEGGGRPSRKYLRLPLNDVNMVAEGKLDTEFIGGIMEYYATPLVGFASYVDVDEQNIVSASVWPWVGMRQLRRGSKRKLEPILP